jgi:predicted aminopeptidase
MFRLVLALLVMSSLAGCQLPYYGQAIQGQMEIWRLQRPVARLLKNRSTPEDLRSRLQVAQEIVAFAEEHLSLPAGDNYKTYADLKRDYVLWSVFATHELSVEPVTWKYPVVGALGYRGYFAQTEAQAFAEEQRAKGLDVAIAPVPAYSTLGWFNDPLLNTFLKDPPRQLTSLIFHELTHKRYYRPGDTAFSEALAVAVEREGVRRWLRHQNDLDGLAIYERRLRAVDDFVRRVLRTRSNLANLYASELPEAVKRTRKREILDGLQAEIRDLLSATGSKTKTDAFWLDEVLGNAHLNVISAYYLRVPEFERLLKACDGDWERFYAEVKELPAREDAGS